MPKPLSSLTNGQLQQRKDSLSKKSSEITAALIAAGRGHERPSDIKDKRDPLSKRWRKNADELAKVYFEIEQRMGPNWYGTLPRGGPRIKDNPMGRKKKTTKKKATPAQLRALAKGRAALKKKRGKKRAKRTARGPTHAKARAALRGKAKAPKRRNPVRPMRTQGYVIATQSRDKRVSYWSGVNWGSRSAAAVYASLALGKAIAHQRKRVVAVAPARYSAAQVKAVFLGKL